MKKPRFYRNFAEIKTWLATRKKNMEVNLQKTSKYGRKSIHFKRRTIQIPFHELNITVVVDEWCYYGRRMAKILRNRDMIINGLETSL